MKLRKLLRQRARARYRGLTSRRGLPLSLGQHAGWHWAFLWMFRRSGAQKKRRRAWRDDDPATQPIVSLTRFEEED